MSDVQYRVGSHHRYFAMQEIINTVNRFANAFDQKDWGALGAVLSDSVELDYLDLRGDKETVTRNRYVESRKAALQELETQHLMSNHVVEVGNDNAVCTASALIYRRQGEEYFNSHAVYRFELTATGAQWSISAIKQRILWNEGNPEIHSGARRANNQK